MEGRVILHCDGCGRTREIAGEIPAEYTLRFDEAVHDEGWAPRPGTNNMSLVCGDCLGKYAGHETVDDEEKVQGRKDLSAL